MLQVLIDLHSKHNILFQRSTHCPGIQQLDTNIDHLSIPRIRPIDRQQSYPLHLVPVQSEQASEQDHLRNPASPLNLSIVQHLTHISSAAKLCLQQPPLRPVRARLSAAKSLIDFVKNGQSSSPLYLGPRHSNRLLPQFKSPLPKGRQKHVDTTVHLQGLPRHHYPRLGMHIPTTTGCYCTRNSWSDYRCCK